MGCSQRIFPVNVLMCVRFFFSMGQVKKRKMLISLFDKNERASVYLQMEEHTNMFLNASGLTENGEKYKAYSIFFLSLYLLSPWN